ncbi:MAG: carbohydrate binding domain-containing protein [Bacteroidota bacterium]
MNGQINITKREPAKFNVNGGGNLCGAGAGFAISLDGVEEHVKYQLQRDGVNVGGPQDPDGLPYWTNNQQPGTYTVVAISDDLPECTQLMNGSAVVKPAPTISIIAEKYACGYYFNASIVGDSGCGINSLLWNMGDASHTTFNTPEVFFDFGSGPGIFDVTVQISFICDGVITCDYTGDKQIQVTPYAPEDVPVEASSYQLDKIINASAATFSDAWPMPTGQGISDNVNPFLSGERGVWRNEGQYAYKETREQSSPVNIATDGTFSMNAFNWEQAALDAVPNWIKANTVTRYSPYGYELENQDVMDISSSSVYDYLGQLISAQGANMRHNEMAFTGFETGVNSGNTGNWTFGSESPQTFEIFPVVSGNGHMATVLAPDLATFNGGIVDVRAVHVNLSTLNFFGSEINSIHNDNIVCKKDGTTGKVILVLTEAPFDGAWLGYVAIRKKGTSTALAILEPSVHHTGASSLKVTSITQTFPQKQLVLDKGKTYFISAWVSVGDPNITTPLNDKIGIDIKLTDAKTGINETQKVSVKGPVVEGWQQVYGTITSSYDKTNVDITFNRGYRWSGTSAHIVC